MCQVSSSTIYKLELMQKRVHTIPSTLQIKCLTEAARQLSASLTTLNCHSLAVSGNKVPTFFLDGRIGQNEGVLEGRILYINKIYIFNWDMQCLAASKCFLRRQEFFSYFGQNILSLPSKACTLLSLRRLGTCLHIFRLQAVEEEKKAEIKPCKEQP